MKTAAERVAAMRRRRQEQGLQMLTLWVPRGRAVEVRELVRRALVAPPAPEANRPIPIAAVAPGTPARVPEVEKTPTPTPPPAKQKPIKWQVVLPPARTPPELKRQLRQAGLVCSAAGRWHGRLTLAQQQALAPRVQEAQGRWERA